MPHSYSRVDLTRIEPFLWRENWLALLGFSQPAPNFRGYIPIRVIGRELFFYMYDPRQEGQMNAKLPSGMLNGIGSSTGINDLGYFTPALLASSFLTGKPYNVFSIPAGTGYASRMYQLFWGVSPSAVRVLKQVPQTVQQNTLEIDSWASLKLQFGYIDGFESPLMSPSPLSEMDIVPGLDFGLGYANPLPSIVDVLLFFVVNHLQIQLVTDADLVYRMLNGKEAVSYRSIGGLTPYNYSTLTTYQINPIPLGASLQQIKDALGGTSQSISQQNQNSSYLRTQGGSRTVGS